MRVACLTPTNTSLHLGYFELIVPSELAIEILKHLSSCGHDVINLPEPPQPGAAAAASVARKNRVQYLFLVAVVDEVHPYRPTANEQIGQYHLLKQQHAAHTAIITVTGDPWEIIYPSLS